MNLQTTKIYLEIMFLGTKSKLLFLIFDYFTIILLSIYTTNSYVYYLMKIVIYIYKFV